MSYRVSCSLQIILPTGDFTEIFIFVNFRLEILPKSLQKFLHEALLKYILHSGNLLGVLSENPLADSFEKPTEALCDIPTQVTFGNLSGLFFFFTNPSGVSYLNLPGVLFGNYLGVFFGNFLIFRSIQGIFQEFLKKWIIPGKIFRRNSRRTTRLNYWRNLEKTKLPWKILNFQMVYLLESPEGVSGEIHHMIPGRICNDGWNSKRMSITNEVALT